MLRQLARLTAPVPGIGDRALAIAVYADAAGTALPANEFGYEGVACVDDAARALTLLCDLWNATRIPLLRSWALGLLDFVLQMQDRDGRFVNFIESWSGRRNEGGMTSSAGGEFWQARGLRGLAKAALVLGDDRAHAGLVRGLGWLRELPVPADVRSIHLRMTVELLQGGRLPHLRADLERWSEEVAASRHGEVLFDNPDEEAPHLWGHIQEGALAESGTYLGRPDLVEIARRSATVYLAPIIESGFAQPTVQPYGVASAHYGVDRLATRTGGPPFTALASQARAWFHGRNGAGRPVYDRVAGRVHDGIDDGRLSENSGAESNVVGALALFGEVATGVEALLPAIERCFPSSVRERLEVAAR